MEGEVVVCPHCLQKVLVILAKIMAWLEFDQIDLSSNDCKGVVKQGHRQSRNYELWMQQVMDGREEIWPTIRLPVLSYMTDVPMMFHDFPRADMVMHFFRFFS